jgi:hypothetical protein
LHGHLLGKTVNICTFFNFDNSPLKSFSHLGYSFGVCLN